MTNYEIEKRILSRIADDIINWDCKNVYNLCDLLNEFDEIITQSDNPVYQNINPYEYFNIDTSDLPISNKIKYSDTLNIYAWDNDGDCLTYDNDYWYVIPVPECKNRL